MALEMQIIEHWALHSDQCLKPAHGLTAPLVIMQVAELACRATMSWLCRISPRLTALKICRQCLMCGRPGDETGCDAARGVQSCVLARAARRQGPTALPPCHLEPR